MKENQLSRSFGLLSFRTGALIMLLFSVGYLPSGVRESSPPECVTTVRLSRLALTG